MADQPAPGGIEQIPCLYIVAVLIVLVIVYIVVKLYQMYRSKSEVRRHVCNYCGRLVVALSRCHQAPVDEKLGSIKCQKCRAEAIPVCSICKKPMDLKGIKGGGLTHDEQ